MAKKNESLPPVDHYRSRREWEEACWRKIQESGELLDTFVTPYERRNLVLRVAVMDRVKSGKSYRQIGEELWLSSQTISGIKKAMDGNRYRSYRERGKTERKKKVYSRSMKQTKQRPRGRPIRTKYGIVYVPY